MNKKECPKCGKFMVSWLSESCERPKLKENKWRCACGYKESRAPVFNPEERFQKKWERANNTL